MNASDQVTVIIPMRMCSEYMSAKQYQNLKNVGGRWTLKEGDKICKGSIAVMPASFAELEANYDFVYTITSVEVKGYGGLAHIKVGGV